MVQVLIAVVVVLGVLACPSNGQKRELDCTEQGVFDCGDSIPFVVDRNHVTVEEIKSKCREATEKGSFDVAKKCFNYLKDSCDLEMGIRERLNDDADYVAHIKEICDNNAT